MEAIAISKWDAIMVADIVVILSVETTSDFHTDIGGDASRSIQTFDPSLQEQRADVH
jgi:hypothetical protein